MGSSFKDFGEAFDVIAAPAHNERLILAIDEYPYIANCYSGIPLYMLKIDDEKSIQDNIKEQFLDTSAYLFEEPGHLIKQECREPMQYNAIIKTIATGSGKISEITSGSGIHDTAATSNYIAKLISIGIVEVDRVYSRIENQLPAYMGFVFEDMCKQYLWQENLKGNLPIDFTDMGRWWGNDPT